MRHCSTATATEYLTLALYPWFQSLPNDGKGGFFISVPHLIIKAVVPSVLALRKNAVFVMIMAHGKAKR